MHKSSLLAALTTLLLCLTPLLGGAVAQNPTRIVFWITDEVAEDPAAEPWFLASQFFLAVEEFNAAQSEIEVVLETVGWGDLQRRLTENRDAGVNEPDVTMVGSSQVAMFEKDGLLAPLTNRFAEWSRDLRQDITQDFVGRSFYDYFFKNNWYAHPYTLETRLLFYRRDKLLEAGYSTSDPPATWDELFEMAARTTDPAQYHWGMMPPSYDNSFSLQTFLGFLLANGGSMLGRDGQADVQSDEFKTAVTRWTALFRERVSPLPDQSHDIINDMFLSGNLTFIIDGPWQISTLQWHYGGEDQEGNALFGPSWGPAGTGGWYANPDDMIPNMGIATLPRDSFGRFGFLGGWALALASTGQHQDAAWEFFKFLTDPTDAGYMRRFALATSNVPGRKTALGRWCECSDGTFDLDLPWSAQPLRQTIEQLVFAYPLQFPNQNSPATSALERGDMLPPLLQCLQLEECDLDEALASLSVRLDAAIAEAQEVNLPEKDLEALQITFYVITGVCALVALVFAVLTVVYRTNSIIHYSSFLFLMGIWLGGLLGYAAVFMWIATASVPICVLRMWFTPFAFVFGFGCLLTKTFRVWRLFDNPTLVMKPITNMDLLKMVGVLVALTLVLVAVWTGVGFPEADFEPVSNDSAKMMTCDYGSSMWVFLGLLFGLSGLMALAACFLSFKTRKVALLFNESVQIAFAVYVVVVIGVICIPLVFVLEDFPEATLLLTAVGGCAAITMALICIFGPKFYFIFSGRTYDPSDVTGFRNQNSTVDRGYSGSKTRTGSTASDSSNSRSSGTASHV